MNGTTALPKKGLSRVEIILIFSAAAALLLGTAVYLMDREWANSGFLRPFVDYQWPRSAVFGAFSGFLPSLLHTYAISVLIIAALWPWPRAGAWVWSLWFAIAATLELLQSVAGNAWLLALERLLGDQVLVGYLKSYALQGQFDSLDLLATGTGCFAALGVTIVVQRSLHKGFGKRSLRVLSAFAVMAGGVVSTVGSGGGGGDFLAGPTDPVVPPPGIIQPWVDITAANAQEVSATVVQDADQVFAFATVIGGQILPGLPTAPDLLSSNSKFNLFQTTLETGAPATDSCTVRGVVTVTGSPENDSVSLSVQDAFDLVFDTCDDGDGYSLDGKFSAIVTDIRGDPRTDVFALSYDVRTVTVTVAFDDSTHTTASGFGFSLAWDSFAFPVTVLSLTPYALALSTQTDDYSLFNGAHSRTVNADISVSTTVLEIHDAHLESPASLGGWVTYETVVPLQASDGQTPESGELLVTNDPATETIRIVIESSTSVRLEIDVDGDGVVDDIQYTTWAAFLG